VNLTFSINEPHISSRVIEKEAEFHSWPTKFPTLYGNWRFVTVRSPPLVLILNHIKPELFPAPISCRSMLILPSQLSLGLQISSYTELSVVAIFHQSNSHWNAIIRIYQTTVNMSCWNHVFLLWISEWCPNTLIRYKHVGPCECVRLETSEYSAACNSNMIYRYHTLVCLCVKISCTDKVSCLAWIVVCGKFVPISHNALVLQGAVLPWIQISVF